MIDGAALLAAMVDAAERDPELGARLRRLLGAAPSDQPIPLRECGVSIRALRAAIAAGELAAVKIGREYRVERGELERWRETKRVQPRQPARETGSPAARAIERARQSGALRVVGGGRR